MITQQDLLNVFSKLIENQNQNIKTFEECYTACMNATKLYARQETISYYEKLYKLIKDYLLNNGLILMKDFNKIKMNEIVNYLKNTRNLSNNSINKYLVLIKKVFFFAEENQLIDYNPIANYKHLPKENKETIIIQDKILCKIKNHLDTLDLDDYYNIRNVLAVYLLLDTGVRANELRNILIKNINIKNNSILLTYTKTKQLRTVYFSDKTKSILIKYLNRINDENSIYLFFDVFTKNKIDRGFPSNFLQKIKKRLSISQSITPHKWRHTLATNLLRNNCNIRMVQKVLGHSSLEITERYLHLTEQETKITIVNTLNMYEKE